MTSRWSVLSYALFVATFAATLYVWFNKEALLPERVPTHWGLSGEPDKFTPRDRVAPMLWIMPGVVGLMVLLGRVIPWLSPPPYQVDTFRPTFEYVFFLATLMMAYMQAVILLAQAQLIGDVGRWMMGGFLIVFAGMGNVMGKVQRNFYVGVRTPWTLASEAVWVATHRVAAWTFVGGSVLGLLLLLTPLNPLASLVVLLAAAVAPALYSLWLFKRLEARGQIERPAS